MQVFNLCLLAFPFGQDLRALALTCDDLRSRSNLHASQRKFFTVWPPNASQCKSCCFLQVLNCSVRNGFFDNLRALASRLASPFGQPTQVCTQVQHTTTCVTVCQGSMVSRPQSLQGALPFEMALSLFTLSPLAVHYRVGPVAQLLSFN